MRIGELARRTGISERALRYYEEQDLLRPVRRPNGYREYQETDVRRVHGIRTLLAAGLGTAVIAEVLPCMADDGEVLVPACAGLAPVLAQERDRIDAAIGDLLAARHMLHHIVEVAAAAGPTPAECEPALA
jgi:DNA-binding transcriptional MerR regulator